MHFDFITIMVLSALAGSIILVMNRGDRLFPIIALVTSGIMTAMTLGWLSISSGKFPIHLILAAVLAIAGGICWSRSSGKSTISAATVVGFVGALLLLKALNIF